MNPRLSQLQPYPFEKLRALLAGVTPAGRPIPLSIGEPQHTTPDLIRRAIADHLDGLSVYPATAGQDRLRETIAGWFERRYRLKPLDPRTQVLPVNGTREALFAFGQAVIDPSRARPAVVCPNPFYQIYEGAALVAGAEPLFLNQTETNRFGLDFDSLTEQEWQRTQLLYVCSPANPSGRVLTLDEWRALFAYSDSVRLRHRVRRMLFGDLRFPGAAGCSRSSGTAGSRGISESGRLQQPVETVERTRSAMGAIAGDASLLKAFLLYRTYHGCAMSLVMQRASIAAWSDETHVEENRRQYRQKFDALVPMLAPVMRAPKPDAGFYLWARVPDGPDDDDARFARDLFAATHVTVLPGQYLARDAHGTNPGRGYVRMALVPPLVDCIEAAERIRAFCS